MECNGTWITLTPDELRDTLFIASPFEATPENIADVETRLEEKRQSIIAEQAKDDDEMLHHERAQLPFDVNRVERTQQLIKQITAVLFARTLETLPNGISRFE
jgi:cytochrome c556